MTDNPTTAGDAVLSGLPAPLVPGDVDLRGRMSKFGFELLYEQCLRVAESRMRRYVQCGQPTKLESEIERIFYASVLFSINLKVTTKIDCGFLVEDESDEEELLSKIPIGFTWLCIRPQAKIGDVRVDFLIHAMKRDDDVPSLRGLVVECDGHDFHERTKEQAARDRARDRAAVLAGYEVFRFTGSELWRDPLGCAGEVIAWATKCGDSK